MAKDDGSLARQLLESLGGPPHDGPLRVRLVTGRGSQLAKDAETLEAAAAILQRLEGEAFGHPAHGIAIKVLRSDARALRKAAEPELARERAVTEGRIARMAESEHCPSMCIRHRQRVFWMPSPCWWYHAPAAADGCRPAETRQCSAMWRARAPQGLSETGEQDA
jgi:hypothetical protein